MTAVLEMAGVSRTYGWGANEVRALIGVDLTVEPGELVAIMGPSGSGKTTLLTIAGGLEDVTAGTVTVEGTELTTLGHRDRAGLRRRSIGYVFQELNLFGSLTAAENVALPLELDGVPARRARVAAVDLLDSMGLDEVTGRYPDELSGGQRQRVAIARALTGDRRLILADEPTGALDTLTSESVLQTLRSACGRAVGAVVVTHDVKLAAWADRVVFLRDGRRVDTTRPSAGPESLLPGSDQ